MSTAPEPIRPIRHLHRHRRYGRPARNPWNAVGWIVLGGLIAVGLGVFLLLGGLGVLVLGAAH